MYVVLNSGVSFKRGPLYSLKKFPHFFLYSEAIVSQVLDELGVEVGDKVSMSLSW